jgi:hypothetical protein
MAIPTSSVGKGTWNKVSTSFTKLPKGSLMGFGIAAAWEAGANINQGKGIGESLAKGAAMGVAEQVIGGWALTALQLAPAIPSMARGYMNYEDSLGSRYKSRRDPSNLNFSYTDTQQAYTMRSAAVQAIQESKMNARSALGGEARLMHR